MIFMTLRESLEYNFIHVSEEFIMKIYDIVLLLLIWPEAQSCHHVTGCVCVYAHIMMQWTENKIRFPRVYVHAWMRASIRVRVCLRACVSSASYVLMSHDQRVLLMLTKIRVVVICPVNCSALLNYSRPGKRLRTAIFSPSLSSSRLLGFVSRTWSGRRMKAPASPLSACHCVIHSTLDDNNIF